MNDKNGIERPKFASIYEDDYAGGKDAFYNSCEVDKYCDVLEARIAELEAKLAVKIGLLADILGFLEILKNIKTLRSLKPRLDEYERCVRAACGKGER